jgi:hypothetical protein
MFLRNVDIADYMALIPEDNAARASNRTKLLYCLPLLYVILPMYAHN